MRVKSYSVKFLLFFLEFSFLEFFSLFRIPLNPHFLPVLNKLFMRKKISSSLIPFLSSSFPFHVILTSELSFFLPFSILSFFLQLSWTDLMNKWKGSRSTQLQEHWFGLSVIHRNRHTQHWDWKQGTKSGKNQHCKIFCVWMCECVCECVWGRVWERVSEEEWVSKLTSKISLARTNDITMNFELTCLEDDFVCKLTLFVQWNKSFFQEPIMNIFLLTSSLFFRLLFSSFSSLLLSSFTLFPTLGILF